MNEDQDDPETKPEDPERNEANQRTIDFIIQQQAQFVGDMERMRQDSEERWKRSDERWARTEEGIRSLLTIAKRRNGGPNRD
jgi:hypothetical protein